MKMRMERKREKRKGWRKETNRKIRKNKEKRGIRIRQKDR